MADQKKIPQRSEIPAEHTWDTSAIYPTDTAWEKEFDETQALVRTLPQYAGRLGESAKTLYEFLTAFMQAGDKLSNLYRYASLRQDEDTRVPQYQAMAGKAMSLLVETNAAIAFATPELLKLPKETLEQFYADEPELELYRRYFTIIQDKKEHTLSDAEEKLLAAAREMAQAPDDIYSKFTNADLTFPDAVDRDGNLLPLSNATFVPYEMSEDRELRRSAYEQYYDTCGRFQNTAAAVLSSEVKQRQFFASARKYDTPLAAAVSDTRVPPQVYHNLVDTVNANLDKLHRYVRLRKKLLGVDELHMYDIYAPMVSGADKVIPFDEAKATVYDALAPMGEAYRSIIKEGFDNRWIDVYENVGKRSGAYMNGVVVHPFVLLNQKDNLDSMFTMAHEMGHAVHSYLSNKTQPSVYRDYVIFVAEVASTCNEALLMEHLLGKTSDKRERAWLINHFLEQFKGTLYRQTMFAEYELRLGQLNAQGVPLTAQKLSEEYKALNAKYFGPDMVTDDRIALEWVRIPHFYYNYYVYQYSTGYSAAIALSRRILKEGAPAVKDYMEFLSGGSSKDPIDLLRGAGVDMASPQPIQDALDLFGKLLDEMEALMA
ncbi:MAG: oligoendopeptidase F [Oscillospiraceae bacterium]|jgi:oligoendopeptidase F|nr:oligoendopeptidase F [Oscillospiraceae bacterium]